MNTILYSEPWVSPAPPVAPGQLYRFPQTNYRAERACLVMVVRLSSDNFGLINLSDGDRRMASISLEEIANDLRENEAVLLRTPITITPKP